MGLEQIPFTQEEMDMAMAGIEAVNQEELNPWAQYFLRIYTRYVYGTDIMIGMLQSIYDENAEMKVPLMGARDYYEEETGDTEGKYKTDKVIKWLIKKAKKEI